MAKKTINYVKPEDCHSPRAHWTLVLVLDDLGPSQYSLALGRWDGVPRLALRWNGNEEEAPVGNPQSRGLPTWFVLPHECEGLLLPLVPAGKQAMVRDFLKLEQA